MLPSDTFAVWSPKDANDTVLSVHGAIAARALIWRSDTTVVVYMLSTALSTDTPEGIALKSNLASA